MADDITLTSTTDSLEQVQAALGIAPAERATEAPPVAEEPAAAPALQAGAVSVTTQPAPKAKGGKPAPAAAPATPAPAEPAPQAPAEPPAPAAEAAETDDEGDDVDEEDDVDPARSAAAADLGRKGGQKRGVLQKRLHTVLQTNGQLRAKVTSDEAEKLALRQRIEALERQAAGAGTAASPAAPGASGTPAPAPAVDPKPVPTDFATYEDWSEANARWVATQVAETAVANALKQERARIAQQQAQQQHETAATTYKQLEEAARTKYEDFDDVVGDPELRTTELMNDVLVNSEVGAEVAYYLGQNPELCKKIYAFGNTARAAKELGKVEAAVEAKLDAEKKAAAKKPVAAPAPGQTLANVVAPAAPAAAPSPATAVTTPRNTAAAPRPAVQRPVTTAPDPIQPVGTGAVASTKPPDQMSFQEYKTWRAAGGGRR